MSDPQIFRIARRLLICSHCSGNTFTKHLSRDAVRSGWFATYDLIYSCSNCGRLEWFQRSAEEKEEIFDEESPAFCPACGADISTGSKACGHCGWQALAKLATPHTGQPSLPPSEPQPPTEIVPVNLSEAALCIQCGADIPPFQTRCPSCGWSYQDSQKTHALTDEEIERGTTVVDLSEPALCLECGADIPPFQTRCPSCGWSYEDERKPHALTDEEVERGTTVVDLSEPALCLECGADIPPFQTRCPSCGWSYEDEDKQKNIVGNKPARAGVRTSQCGACGASIPPNKESCPQCGWLPSASQ